MTQHLQQVIRLDDPLGTPTFTDDFVNVGDIEDFASFLDAPQSGSAVEIETNDRRALDAWLDKFGRGTPSFKNRGTARG